MSGIISGIGKIFSSVAGSLSTTLGSAVTGVGATVATAGAATGGTLFSGGISSIVGGLGSGTGVLGNILNGVGNLVTKGLGGLVDTGMSAGKGLLDTFSPGGMLGGGMAPSAAGAAVDGATTAATAAPSLLDKAGDFLTSEAGAGLIGGLGKGWAEYESAQAEAENLKERDQMLYDFKREQQQTITDSYGVPASALPDGASTGAVKDGKRPTPAQQYSREFDMVYDAEIGRIVKKPRA